MPSTKHDLHQMPSQDESRAPLIEELRSDLDILVNAIAAGGKLDGLIEIACKKAQTIGLPSHPESGDVLRRGVQAAVEAYADWERTKEGLMDMEVQPQSVRIGTSTGESDILPLSLVGKWVAWSSDGMQILAAAETSEEAERLAVEAGEPDPILHRPMALR